jgi:hypothetical protein
MKFKFPMCLTMISALAFLTVDISEVQAQLESYDSASLTSSMTTATPAPVCCQCTSNYSSQSLRPYPVPQTGPIPSYRAVQFARNNPEATFNPHADNMIAPPVTHRGMTYVPLFSRSTNRSFFRFRRNAGGSAYRY